MRQTNAHQPISYGRLLLSCALGSLVPVIATAGYMLYDVEFGVPSNPILDDDEWIQGYASVFGHLPLVYLLLTLNLLGAFLLTNGRHLVSKYRLYAVSSLAPLIASGWLGTAISQEASRTDMLLTVSFVAALATFLPMIGSVVAWQFMAHNYTLQRTRGDGLR